MKQVYIVIQGTVAAFIAWLSAKMGILLPVMGVLMGMMVMDYITGMLASKREALDHPDDPTYGWCSRRGAEGIIKKVGYLCVIAVAMVIDYIIIQILATAHRCVSVLPDGNAAAELFTSNNSFMSRLSFDFNEQYKNELVSLCLDARDIISRSQRHESEALCDHALQIINEEYMNEDLSLTDASDKLGVSPNYLSALIKKKKSKNFVALVTERRMKAASDLLLCTSMKIFEISQKCGYSDQHYFSYCFKKYYGVSPNKYREERLGGKDI